MEDEYGADKDFEDSKSSQDKGVIITTKRQNKSEISFRQKSLSKVRIGLLNFDPFDVKKKINSSCSIEVCKSNGVKLSELYHKTYNDIKGNVFD